MILRKINRMFRSFSTLPNTLVDIKHGPFESLNLTIIPTYQYKPKELQNMLHNQIPIWSKQEGKNSIWLKIPISHASLATEASLVGFKLHHTTDSNEIMMSNWISSSDHVNRLPSYATHFVGVGGFVHDENTNKVLVIKEQGSKHWKLPGGTSDAGEDIATTAIREIKEETGIDCVFNGVICMRELHDYRYNKSDLYFLTHMTPISFDISKCDREIANCEWLDIVDYHESLKGMDINSASKFNLYVSSIVSKSKPWIKKYMSDNYESREKSDNNSRNGREYNIYHTEVTI